ncbi:sulfite oxidase [Aplysia californica]|uniref:sulfite oxidase n=1 Tax=Aplysia californica TaxID=6500 RepID=A0ABM1A980_APLCA|nr:sulfite oxidase [Aplysia californica]
MMAHMKTVLFRRSALAANQGLGKFRINKLLEHSQVPCAYLSTLKEERNPSGNSALQQVQVDEWSGNEREGSKRKSHISALALAGSIGVGLGLAGKLLTERRNRRHHNGGGITATTLLRDLVPVASVSAAESAPQPGVLRKDLPTYSAAEVASHNSRETGIWVTFQNGVYDITEYVLQHPGGKKILMASGKSMEPFWNVYSVHKNDEVYEILESLRIGNIVEVATKKEAGATDDPYRNDPERSPLLIPSSKKPFNAEPPQQMLVDRFLTPNHLFFVRNHLPVPSVEPKDYRLDVSLDSGSKSFTYDDLKSKFDKRSVVAVTQCAGNRRSEMVKVKPVKGLNWGSAAISNAKWSGVCLDDLLLKQGVDIEKVRGKYIVFEGMDKQPDDSPYGASIPLELARMLKRDIIIAYEMNGEPIPRDHGFPIRVIIPGVVGARQVKWLNKIYFSGEESTSHWQRRDYKGFNSSIDWHNVDFDSSVSISQLPVISAICEPEEDAELEEGAEEVTLRGYAWSGGGRGIIRVDVSADGGKTWQEARLKPNGQSPYRSYAWTLWEADVPLPTGARSTTLVVKAVDISYNVQPDSVEGIWNLRGCLSNAWHRVKVNIPAES